MTAPRIYCVPCHEICPHMALDEQESWMAEHTRTRHAGVSGLDKGPHYAPVPAGWGGVNDTLQGSDS